MLLLTREQQQRGDRVHGADAVCHQEGAGCKQQQQQQQQQQQHCPRSSHEALLITRHTSHITHHTSHITHHPSHIIHHPSHITLHTSHISHYTSPITHHTSHITHHTSPITHHPSPITHHPSPITLHLHVADASAKWTFDFLAPLDPPALRFIVATITVNFIIMLMNRLLCYIFGGFSSLGCVLLDCGFALHLCW